MTRAQFIKNLGIFGTLLTVLGYHKALALKDNDPVNVTNTTIFDLEFFSDRYGKKHNCENLINQINDYFRSNKRPNKQQILESGRFFHEKFIISNRLVAKIGRGTSSLTEKEKISEIEDFLALSILNGKSYLLLGDGNSVSSVFHNADHLFICMSNLNLGKKDCLYPKGLINKFAPFVYKEMAETYLKTDFFHTNAIYYLSCLSTKKLLNKLPENEIKRLTIVNKELKLMQYDFHSKDIRNKIKNSCL